MPVPSRTPSVGPPPPTGQPLSATPPPGLAPPHHEPAYDPVLVTSPPPRRKRPTALIMGLLVAAVVFLGGGITTGVLLAKDESRPRDAAPAGAATVEPPTVAEDGAAAEPAPNAGKDTAPARPHPSERSKSDRRGETKLGNKDPGVGSSADIKRVRVLSPTGDGPGWVLVRFWGAPAPDAHVVVYFDTDGDDRPEFVTWRHLTNGNSGSGPVEDWKKGTKLANGIRGSDPRFQAAGHVRPEAGVAFPFDFAPGEVPTGAVRVNVQVFNDDAYYDYVPHRHEWMRPVAAGTGS